MKIVKGISRVVVDPTVIEITAEDVGTHWWRNPSNIPPGVYTTLGRILTHDVGRRLYLSDGIWQAESDEQRDKRLASPATG